VSDQLQELLGKLRALIASRSARERWLMAGTIATLLGFGLYSFVIAPLQASIEDAELEVERQEAGLLRAVALAPEIAKLRTEVAAVQDRVKPGDQTNLLTLVSALAEGAQLGQQIQQIREKRGADFPGYPETSAEVRLASATILQTAQLLYAIEKEAPLYLIIRSLVIKQRRDGSDLVDVTFTVSSFQRGT
jgi:hypothetical protein